MPNDHQHVPDIIDGVKVPPRVVNSHEELVGVHQHSICIESGASLEILGTQRGSVTFQRGSSGVIVGQLQGSLHVASGATVVIHGVQQGSVHISQGGVVRVEPRGRLAGSLHNDGTIENGGIRGGAVSGSGSLNDLEGSTVKQPVLKDGAHYYTW